MRNIEFEVPLCWHIDESDFVIPINIDFDGTCVTHEYPRVGRDNEHCVETLKKWVKEYHVGLTLHTTRGSETIQDAIDWFKKKEIPLMGVGLNPLQLSWTDTKKSYGYYIDDVALGIPLILEHGERPRVDWKKLDEMFTPQLEKMNYILKQKLEIKRR